MKKQIILHIDMNSYFAAVEQQANPFLRGKSVGVCAYLSPNGVIIASSMEAKAKGIKTGCQIKRAQKLDPQIVLLENEPAKYRSTTAAIFNILKDYSDKVEPYSIDEAFVDLTGWVKDIKEGVIKARKIQNRIKNEVGIWLDSSAGISWTKFLAKFASDIAPKKSVLAIPDHKTLDKILQQRSLCDAWGINYRTENRLRTLKINTLDQLKNANPHELRQKLGRYGYYLWANINGLEINQINSGIPKVKSIGHSYSLPQKTTDKNYLNSILYKLCEKTGRRLRQGGWEAHIISLRVGFTLGSNINKSKKIPSPLFSTEEIFSPVQKWLKDFILPYPVKILAVSLSSLSPISKQMSFFEDRPKTINLSAALDKINSKYGEYTIVRGQMFDTNNQAPDRIGFRKAIFYD